MAEVRCLSPQSTVVRLGPHALRKPPTLRDVTETLHSATLYTCAAIDGITSRQPEIRVDFTFNIM